MSQEMFNEYGYELPNNIPAEVKSQGFEYYRHPVGIFTGIFGRLIPKYKDIAGDKCEADAPGAYITHFIAQLWITKIFPSGGETKNVLSIGNDKILIPVDVKQAAELYYPLMVSIAPKDQWMVHRLFKSFSIPNHDNLRIIYQNPAKPTEQITNFRNFAAYYGIQCKFTLAAYVSKAGKEGIVCSNVELFTDLPRVESSFMAQLEKEVQLMIDNEIAARQDAKDNVVQDPPPSADDIFGEDLGEYGQ